jgi:hypothetical protein
MMLSRSHRLRFVMRAALLGAALSCSAPGNPASHLEGAPTEHPGAAPLVVDDARSSFAAMESRKVLAAAMTYPRAAMVTEAPVSLTASDGTGLELVSLDGRAVIDGPLAFTELRLQFRNPEDRVIEGRFAITLPPEATVSRLAMRLDGGWQEAEVVERQLARRAYEDFLHRRQDPALLEKEAGNEFRARIFPIPARGVKDIIISYSQPLVGAGATYKLHLRGLPQIAHLRVHALVGQGGPGKAMSYRAVTMEERGYVPDKDFAVEAPATIPGVSNGDLVAARLRPELSAETQAIAGLVVLFDTSASRAPGFSREVERLGALVHELAAVHGASMKLAVATFDQSVAPVYTGPAGGFGKAELDAVLARRPLGASNLHAALSWAGSQAGLRRVLIITDGIATAGHSQADELIAAVKSMGGTPGKPGAIDRLDVILAGGIRDTDVAGQLVRGTLERDGVVLDADTGARILARRLSQTTASGIAVSVAGARWVWPKTLDGLQPGDEVLIFAGRDTGNQAASLSVTLSGGVSQTLAVPLTPVARPLLERAAVQARIARLGHERNGLDASTHKVRRAELEKQIIDLSTRYRVLSDLTALLVLESEADYQRHGIDRRSLADILTVGEKGVEVFHRTAPVVLIASDPASTPVTRAPDSKGDKMRAKKSESRAAYPADADMDEERESFAADVGDSEGKDEVAAPAPADQRPRQAPARRPPPASAASPGLLQPATEAVPEPEPSQPDMDVMDDMAAGAVVAGSREVDKPAGTPPYSGKLAEIMDLIARGQAEDALVQALGWRNEDAGDVMALIALGEALEASGNTGLAARAYGSIIDLFPARADMRRFAGQRLERLGAVGAALAADTYAKAVAQRPDHLTGHRLLAFALLRRGDHAGAFAALETGLGRTYPAGRFSGGERILREDLGLVAAAWIKRAPAERAAIEKRLAAAGAVLATRPSLRFVLNWETDANDVDFHIYDGKGGHAFYSQKALPSGGALYEDVTTGFGPECFTIEGQAEAYPYTLQIHYYSRGPMGYGMGKLEIIEHDGAGDLRFEQRPYVVMNDGAYVDLGKVERRAAQSIR